LKGKKADKRTEENKEEERSFLRSWKDMRKQK
jgi:hypothetical protein